MYRDMLFLYFSFFFLSQIPNNPKKKGRARSLPFFYACGKGTAACILDEYGDGNVYRVTNYKHPFDGYKGEPVIVFDEFRSSLPLADMLNYLDVYPLMLPSRYADRVACYTRVFIVSNISIKEQYPIVQLEEPASYAAFLRRINDGIWEMLPDNGSESF